MSDICYSKELATEVCRLLAGGVSLRKLGGHPGMPCKDTVLGWLQRIESFRVMYAAATDMRAEGYVDEIVDIADGATPETAEVDKLRIHTRGLAAKLMAPKKYGSTRVALTDPDGNPLTVLMQQMGASQFPVAGHEPKPLADADADDE